MKKKTKMLVVSAVALLVIAVSVVLIIISNKPKEEATFYTIDDIKNKISSDISKIQKGKYKNLICDDFSASLEDIEGVYNIEIQNNNDYLKKSLVEKAKYRVFGEISTDTVFDTLSLDNLKYIHYFYYQS